jgi:predicted AlkP superfamily phosphohydrolase/phosphomutase
MRFHLVRLEPDLRLHASPINFDPDTPLFPISSPPEYSRDLSKQLGTYYTAGLVEDHNGLMNERFDEDAFLAQCDDAWRERRTMMVHELERFDAGLFYCLFDTPDRVQHMLWRAREPGHPANRGRRPPPMGAIEEHYRHADQVIGQALDFTDDRTLLIVLSDHGFGGFQRGFQVNKWLLDHGLLALKVGAEPGAEAGDLLRGIDWDQTRAYGLGLSGLYLNLQGREGRGTVKADEAAGLKSAICEALSGLKDPERGCVAIRSAIPSERLYDGPFAVEAPDVILNYAMGYRVAWGSSMGGVPAGDPFEDNTRLWAGDHVVDPELVPGVLLMNRTFRSDQARLADLAPTICTGLGLPMAPSWEGSSLLSET